MSGCSEWTSLLSVFRLHCDMAAILSTPGNLNNLDPSAELPTAHHELIPGLCLTDSAPLHHRRGNRALQGVSVLSRTPPSPKEIRIEIRNRAFENCFNRLLRWIADPGDFRSNMRLDNLQQSKDVSRASKIYMDPFSPITNHVTFSPSVGVSTSSHCR